MFDLPALRDGTPLSMHLAASDLYNLVSVIEALDPYSGQSHRIRRLCLKEKLSLLEAADRFDCKKIQSIVQRSLEDQYSNSSAIHLLKAASHANSIVAGKRAIIKMEDDDHIEEKGIYNIWIDVTRQLRPSWQIEFQRLF